MSFRFPGSSVSSEAQSKYGRWLESLKERDPVLYAELRSRLEERVSKPKSVLTEGTGISLESVALETGADMTSIALETIVREGRPALPIQQDLVTLEGSFQDAAAKTIMERLKAALSIVQPVVPLVGRIDVDNYPTSMPYLGTGWLVARDLVVTNRHVADLMAQSDNGAFRFRPGRFGEALRVTMDYKHELGIQARSVRRIRRVLWIEKDDGPDIAFIELEESTDGANQPFIPLATEDAQSGNEVVVIGYPARAPAHIVPDQAWMDRIYGGVYDVKRIAPGLMGENSRGWATHDCTTLGGNSGSVVVDMNSGNAVALHFAGLYMIENYAVPASTIKKYLKNRPWQPGTVRPDAPVGGVDAGKPQAPVGPGQPPAAIGGGASGVGSTAKSSGSTEVSVTIPLTITVSLGTPQATGTITTGSASPPPGRGVAAPTGIEDVARSLAREHRMDGVYSVWPGYEIREGRLSDTECLVVSAHPDRLEAVRSAMPQTYNNYLVEVRRASIDEQMEAVGVLEAPVTSVAYNDEDRTGEGFSFDWVDEEMKLLLHVGPERSWVVLSDFLAGAKSKLVSSMYEFHAAHIAEAIEQNLDQGASLTLVMATQSRDPKNNKIKEGDFDRSETFDRWEQQFKQKFGRIFVPVGSTGLVANSYHIKVTVADEDKVWLSSGNWKHSSQPVIAPGDLDNPKVTNGAGNREWHVLIQNETLARRFRNHIKADFQQSLVLGGQPEAIEAAVLVDVPRTLLEAMEFEAAPARVLKPLPIDRRVRVKPLLTPDKKGSVFSRAVLELIRSAKKQLVFQNQYIKMRGAGSGFLKELVEALAERAKKIKDFRIILRTGDAEMDYNLSQLQRKGIDPKTQVRVLADTHTKGIVVDGKRVLIGSHNWSSSGVTLNRDASLIFDDEEIAQYYLEAFELDWNRSREPHFEFVTEGVRPAEGESPPPGFERMTLSSYLEG
jgi:V8-like Glu-specific endopeptidase